MAGDEYSQVLRGGLKIKGAKVQKKKKQTHAKPHTTPDLVETVKPDGPASPEKDTKVLSPEPAQNKTEAERKFEEVQRRRMEKILEKKASKSHKEAVEEYNKYLSSLTDHNDLPKIGPG